MKVKRMLCLLMTALMMLSMLGSFAFGASASAVSESVADQTIFVNPSWTPANLPDDITVGEKTYPLFWGKNAYSNPQKAVDVAPEFGTVYLCAGGYTTTITVKKSLTILGAKHGIDPNIRGASDKELWTLNPERGMDETLLQGSLNLGAAGGKQYSNQLKVVVDGIMIGGKGQIAANDGTAGYGEFELKNIYLKNSLHTSPAFFMTSYYNGAANAFKRFVSIENMRVEGQTGTNVMTVTADELDISGLYMHTDCTQPLFVNSSASNGPTDEVYWNIHDSFFAASVSDYVLDYQWLRHSSNSKDMTLGRESRSKIINNIYNNVFLNNRIEFYMAIKSGDSGIAGNNLYFNFIGNTFYNDSTSSIIYGYSEYAYRQDWSDQVVVKDNRFIGAMASTYYLKNNKAKTDVSGNYSYNGTTVTSLPLHANASATESWYWLDEAMTVKSTDENPGTGYSVSATQGLVDGKPVTVSDSLPDTAVLVNPDWSESTVPATYTVRGKTFTLNWGVNAFADIPTADAAVRDFGTMYLCPGTYSTAHTTTKNLTILGPNFGINPNVKGQNERDLWTLNPNRSTEANITASLNLSAATGVDNADFMVVDGVQLTGTGNLRSNAATIQGYAKVTIKNIYIKNNSTNPLYLFPYYPGTGADANTFRRDVTIENVRVEKHTGSDGVLRLTAERADISGVYMHTDCTKTFLTTCSASNGPTTEAVWNLHDNQFAAPVARGIYLNWESVNAYSSVSLATGVSKRNKVVNNVYNNVFVNFYNASASSNNNRSLAARFKGQNGYFNLHGNAFYQDNAVIDTHIAFQFYSGGSMDYSDQMTCKNNRFIGEYAYDVYYNQSTAAVDISGNYAVKDGTVRGLLTSGNAGTTAQDYYYLDSMMTKKSTDTAQLKAPAEVAYEMDQAGSGRADGVVTITLPAGHDAEDIYLFWGDDSGKLEGYSAFAPIKVGSNQVTARLKNGSIVPAGATRLLAYSFSEACGMSEDFAAVALPADAAMNEAALGEPVLEFQAVGDIHVSTTTNGRIHHAQHMEAMLEDVKAISPDSIGIFSNGDMADRGIDADYERLLEVVSGVENAPTVYYTFGNHETFRNGLPMPSGSTLSDYQGPFYDHLGSTIPADAVFSAGERYSSLSYTFTKNGIKFISLGTDVLDQNWLELSDATIAWLKTQLDTDRDATKPVFIIMHQPMQDTNSDSYNVDPDTAEKLKALLKDYPEVVMFNGHTHDSLYEPFTFYQGDEIQPNFFNCSAVGYIPVTYHGNPVSTVGAEGYYVYVYEDRVIVKGRDFLNGKWIASAQYVISTDDAAGDVSEKIVESPVSGRVDSELVRLGNTVGGNVTVFLPTGHNATHVALYFADADTGFVGEKSFATAAVSDPFASGNVAVGFADAEIPEGADYILAYAYSETLGFSAGCEVVVLDELEDVTEDLANGNVCTTGNIKSDKKIYKLGEPIYVTATMHTDGDWVGMQLASVTSGSFLNYQLNVAGSGVAVDITDKNCINFNKFQQVTPGYWEIGWIPVTKSTFQTGKTADNLITIHIIDAQNEELALPGAEPDCDAKIDGESFATLAEAIAAAESGDTVVLQRDVIAEKVVLNPGIALDLNGNTLEVKYLIGFKGAVVGDSSKDNSGYLKVDQNKVALDVRNGGYLPVYNGNGYLFVKVSLENRTAMVSEKVFAFSPLFEKEAHEALMKGCKASGVRVIVRLSWEKAGNYTATQDFAYVDDMVKTVIGGYDEVGGNYEDMFVAEFAGTEAGQAENVTVSAVIVSDTGVELASAATEF